MPEADAEGAPYKLSMTTKVGKWYNARDNVFSFDFEFFLRAESEISPKDTAEENGNPNPQNFVSIFRVHLN
jgi:hypothetical protein